MTAPTASYYGFNLTTAKIQTAGDVIAATTATDTFTANGHGLIAGQAVTLTSLGSMTNVALNTTYYVVSPATNTFKIAASVGGSAITVGTGSPNVTPLVETNVEYPEKIELKAKDEDITFKGGGQERSVYVTTALTAELAPDCLNVAAAGAVFGKDAVVTGLPDGLTSLVWFGELSDTTGVAAGLWGEGSAIKRTTSGVESRVDIRVWLPLGTLTLNGGPTLETAKKAGQHTWRLGATRTTKNVIGGELPGVASGGAFYAIAER
jgi:hypothetical protein